MSRAKTITLDYRDFLQGPYQIQVPEGYKRIQLNAFSLEKNSNVQPTDWFRRFYDFVYEPVLKEVQEIENLIKKFSENNDDESFKSIYKAFYNSTANLLVSRTTARKIENHIIVPFFSDTALGTESVRTYIISLVYGALETFEQFLSFYSSIVATGLTRSNQFSIKGFIKVDSNYLSSDHLDVLNEEIGKIYSETVKNFNKILSLNNEIVIFTTQALKLHSFVYGVYLMQETFIPNIQNFVIPKMINRIPQSSPLYDRYVKTCPESIYLNIQGINSWRNTAAVFNGEPFILGMQGNTFELCSPTLIISMNDIEGNYFNASSALIQFTFI